jgi:hypothetical protein
MPKFLTTGLLRHNGVAFEPGTEVDTDELGLDEAGVAQLRSLGALALREELETAEAAAARRADLEAENATLSAELAALKEQLAAAPAGRKSRATDD